MSGMVGTRQGEEEVGSWEPSPSPQPAGWPPLLRTARLSSRPGFLLQAPICSFCGDEVMRMIAPLTPTSWNNHGALGVHASASSAAVSGIRRKMLCPVRGPWLHGAEARLPQHRVQGAAQGRRVRWCR